MTARVEVTPNSPVAKPNAPECPGHRAELTTASLPFWPAMSDRRLPHDRTRCSSLLALGCHSGGCAAVGSGGLGGRSPAFTQRTASPGTSTAMGTGCGGSGMPQIQGEGATAAQADFTSLASPSGWGRREIISVGQICRKFRRSVSQLSRILPALVLWVSAACRSISDLH